jgi:hypothetical protein
VMLAHARDATTRSSPKGSSARRHWLHQKALRGRPHDREAAPEPTDRKGSADSLYRSSTPSRLG